MSLSFTKPVISSSNNNPPALANKSFPYSQLTDRRFEELIYSIYKKEIETGTLQYIYDDINILQGVRERGRDCSFHLNNDCVGIIQCKHSIDASNRISQPECAREIIKFILHIIIDPNIVKNSQQIDYYFTVSYGFAETALKLLNNFNVDILVAPKLQEWTEEVIKKNVALKGLVYANIENELKAILGSIKVKKVIPQDLDVLLNKAGNEDIIQTFFEVKTVVNTKEIQNSLAEINDTLKDQGAYKQYSTIPEDVLVQDLKKASFQLTNIRGEFGDLVNSHIPRNETEEIYNWILSSILPNEKPIALLVGNAGMGKTVILKDLQNKLEKENIPTLGIKADKYYVESISELTNRLGLQDSIEKSIYTLKESYERIVILIDQIDALSQSLSAKREYLDTFNFLVNNLSTIDNVRIIISVRTYDLNYDTDLTFYRNQKKIEIQLLDVQAVVSILKQLGVPDNSYSGSLIELLRVPNHLNVFCKIYNSKINLSSIKTLQDLYEELWCQRVSNVPLSSLANAKTCKEALYAIAARMYELQRISIFRTEFLDDYKNEISYLQSSNLITSDQNEIQFFHQTFYDFIFAKHFIDTGRPIQDYLIENNQGLYIRSSLKMILMFLRQKNPKNYILLIDEILVSKKYRFHLKLLVLNLLAFSESPLAEEIQLATNRIFKKKDLLLYFLESINSEAWLKLVITNNVLTNMSSKEYNLKNVFRMKSVEISQKQHADIIYTLFARNLPRSRHTIIPYLLDGPNFLEKDKTAFSLLYYLKIWDQKEAFDLYEKYASASNTGLRGFYSIMEDAAHYNLPWVTQTYRTILQERINKSSIYDREHIKFDYQDSKLLKAITNIDLKSGIQFAFELVELIIEDNSAPSENYEIEGDIVFWGYDNDREYRSDGPELILSRLIKSLRLLAKEDKQVFRAFFQENLKSKKSTILLALTLGILESFEIYLPEILQLSCVINEKGGFNQNGKLQYWLRNLLAKVYPLLNSIQKDTINQIYLSVEADNVQNDKSVSPEGIERTYTDFLKLTYISSLPVSELTLQPDLHQEFNTLKAKFTDTTIIDQEPNVVRMRPVAAPFSEVVYKSMSYEEWKESFKKVDLNTDFGASGSRLEHSRAFQKEVKENPLRYIGLVTELIDENTVSGEYIIKGIEGLVEGNYSPDKLLILYKKATLLQLNREQTLYLVWKSDYFIENKIVDNDILQYLIDCSINHEDPESDRTVSLGYGINSVRGAAVIRLIACYYNVAFKDRILTAVDKVVEDKTVSVRIAALSKLAFLNYLDPKVGIKLFIKLTSTDEPEIIKSSFIVIQYFINHDLKKLLPYLRRIAKIPSTHKDLEIVLTVAWMNGKKESYPLLKKLLRNSTVAREGAISVATTNFFEKDVTIAEKCRMLFVQFLNDKNSEIIHQYSVFFLKLEPEQFQSLLPLLKLYSKSVAAKQSPYYYYEFLLKCVKKYPTHCIDLLANWEKYDKPDITQSGHYDSEPIAVVIGAYNALRNTEEGKKYMIKALDIFDNMLMDYRFRSSANKVIEDSDL